MPHRIIFIFDVLHGFNSDVKVLADEILRDNLVGC